MKKSRRSATLPALLFSGVLALAFQAGAAVQSYVVEAINDPFIKRFPNPKPRHVVSRTFAATGPASGFIVPVWSKHLHNISVRIENTGDRVLKNPYLQLLGPWGCDFRSLDALAAGIAKGAKTPREKFLRAFQWLAYHYERFGTASNNEYPWGEFPGNALRLIDQYGGGMCGESVEALGALLHAMPPAGSLVAHKVDLDAHQTGEVFLNGGWRAFDSNPSSRWIYDLGEHDPPITFRWLRDHGERIIRRVKPLTGWDIWWAIEKAPCTCHPNMVRPYSTRPFRFDLLPRESITMYFDMRGRVDKTSIDYAAAGFNRQSPEHRNPCDYASAVFDLPLDFSQPRSVQRSIAAAENVKWTPAGLAPADPARPAFVVIPWYSAWSVVGAKIEADFATAGTVAIARKADVMDTKYSPDLQWTRLSPRREEYGKAGIEGVMAFWLKFEFHGPGAGLRRARIAVEVQMSPLVMPGLRYGENHYRFTAAGKQPGTARITVTYDDQAPYDAYEPATGDYGAYIHYRVGGDRTRTWCKNLFYKNIKKAPNGTLPITVEIFKGFGNDFGRKVRTLKSGRFKFGEYWWYWDGRDARGRRLPPGLYAYKITGDVGEGPWGRSPVWGEPVILFDQIWPTPNEILWPSPGKR